ncbi:hypothetical protein, partial [Dialister invisus]|uniref:hypothetical protein n=1 Tax=Dialister invisus TaxID=218538 RepID=UPI003AB2D2F1
MEKTGNGTMTRSEESITLMTSCRLPHHGYRFFATLVLLSKSSKSLDHMLRKEYTVYCFEILWIGHMLRYHTDG